jgi:hypothetical protein
MVHSPRGWLPVIQFYPYLMAECGLGVELPPWTSRQRVVEWSTWVTLRSDAKLMQVKGKCVESKEP